MNRRLKAFTIMEVTIVMLIASIVIGMTYSIYMIVVRSYSAFNIKNTQMATLLRLDELLKKDFMQADIILKEQDGIVLKSNNKQVSYIISPEQVIRTCVAIDTFTIKEQVLTTSFEAQPVTQLLDGEEQNRIDDMELTLLFENEKIIYHYHKWYSSVNLIERKANAIN
jgi:type II secretory pathway component PulJ